MTQRMLTGGLVLLACLCWAESEKAQPTPHWSFIAPVRPVPPLSDGDAPAGWIRNPIDQFTLARMREQGLEPSPEADKLVLFRRLYLDLIGLPPAPDQVQAFLEDRSPGAYERLVDNLLGSPHFGERWGRHWLDLARYADSSGFQVDRPRSWAALYRHWVINAFNEDIPFDQFTIEQLAGDLLPEATDAQKVAAGFHRLTLTNHEDGTDKEEFRCKEKVDRVGTTGTVWFGLTVACAECHSHKYDPITQKEFFQLYSFFDRAEPVNTSVNFPAGIKGTAGTFRHLTNEVRTHIHVRGDFLRKGDEVTPGVLSALHPFQPRKQAGLPDRLDLARWVASPENPLLARVAVNRYWKILLGHGLVRTPDDFGSRGSLPTHPQLLDWLATEFQRQGWSRKAMIRLIVNSATYRQSSDSSQAQREADPENIWLARQNRFRVESEIIRDGCLMVGGLLNLKIGGGSFRPFMPPAMKFLGTAGAWKWNDTKGPDRLRRGLYIYGQRTVPYPVSMTFNQADPTVVCVVRERSNTPLQALTLLNHGIFVEAAQGLASRMLHEAGPDPRARIRHGFELCLARSPSPEELARLVTLHDQLAALVRSGATGDPAGTRDALGPLICGDPGHLPEEDTASAVSLVSVAQVLMNLDEFMTRE